jgi:transcription antitermination factor NusA-like protein
MVMGGANHPALGELVLGELYYDKMCRLLDCADKKDQNGKIAVFSVPRGEISKAIGHGGRNKKRLTETYGLKRVIVEEQADTEKMILNLK